MAAALLTAIAVAAFSCEKPPENSPVKGLSLSDDDGAATVVFDAPQVGLTIVARRAWTLTVTSGREWITPDTTSGEAGSETVVMFALGKNTDETPRTGTVAIRASGEEEPYEFTITQQAANVLTGVNAWIYEQMKGWYYWNNAVKAAAPPDNGLGYEEFLETLIEGLKGAQDDTENPPTIDGMWNKTQTERDHIYSYIDRTGGSTRADASTETEFGFGVQPFEIQGTYGRYELLVTWVRPGSPADKAGLKRGVWIRKFENADIFEPQYENFWYRLNTFRGGYSIVFTDSDGKPYNLTATGTKISPILHKSVITASGGKKVAYLVYHQFDPGQGSEFDNEVRAAFGEFKSAGVSDLVLDLRYNRGGYISSCRVLTSLAANVGSGRAFIKMKRNSAINDVYPGGRVGNPEVQNFLNENNRLSNLQRVYVLATRTSASAAELVINSLRGAGIEVIHIGARTNGKNVGMDLRDTSIDGYGYQLWPVTFKILNALDFTDYADGFEPTYYIDELLDAKSAAGSGVIRPFGDTSERLLAAALRHIVTGSLNPDARTRSVSAAAERRPVDDPAPIPGGGAKYRPEPQTRTEP